MKACRRLGAVRAAPQRSLPSLLGPERLGEKPSGKLRRVPCIATSGLLCGMAEKNSPLNYDKDCTVFVVIQVDGFFTRESERARRNAGSSASHLLGQLFAVVLVVVMREMATFFGIMLSHHVSKCRK